MTQLFTDHCDSPIGTLFVAATNERLCFLGFNEHHDERSMKLLKHRFVDMQTQPKTNILNMRDRIKAYFDGDWASFSDLTLETKGTDFQQSVWQTLREIPTGETISYEKLARNIQKPKAVRAVANANANNPIAIIIPCHRVIAKNGTLSGYAGGVNRKEWLLKHEGYINPVRRFN